MDAAALRRLVEARLALHEAETKRQLGKGGRSRNMGSVWLLALRIRREECKAILQALDAMEAAAPAPAERGPA